MMTRLFLLILSAALAAQAAWAQADIVSGNARTYAGDTLRMYSISDYITRSESLISTAVVDRDGNFTFTAKVDGVAMAYIDLSVFKCMLFLQPNTRQTIVLPEKQQIRPEDEVNPFFRKYEFYPTLVSPDPGDLNAAIPAFDRLYAQAMNRIITSQGSFPKARADSIVSAIASQQSCSHPFFRTYMRYRLAMLEHTAYMRNPDAVISKYFTGSPVLEQCPAYNDLFGEIYANAFTNFKNLFQGSEAMYQAIRHKSYHALRQQLAAEKAVASDQLADYIILKGIKDAYYGDTISKECLVALADSMASLSKTKSFRKIAEQVSGGFTKLMCGYPAPDFAVYDASGKKYTIQDFSGKFTYLVFFNPGSYTAMADLEMLSDLRGQIPPEALEIALVFVSSGKESFEAFSDYQALELGFPAYWYGNSKQMLRDYAVRAYPTYYLINPEGMLSMNPAPSPQEYFQIKFDAIYRSWKNEELRKQYRGSQGIK